MTLQKQVAPLSMSMDSDSGDKYINTSGGVVRERICMRTNELDGDSLFNKKLKGNVLVDLVMPAGVNKCIGWCPDHKTESLLWFVWNSGVSNPVFPLTGAVDSNGQINANEAYSRALALGYSLPFSTWVNQIGEFDGTDGSFAMSDYLFQLTAGFVGTFNEWLGDIMTYEQWYIQATAPNHCVLRYFVNTDTIQKVWYDQSGLGLQDTFLSACIADGRVSWVNGTEQPKSFNIEKAVNFTNTLSGEAYLVTDNLAEDILPLIKRPPQFAPEVSYASELEEAGLPVNFNNLRGKLFQFKYNFIYEDDQESAYSEISKVPMPEGDLTVSGEWVMDYSINNAINLLIDTGNQIVRKINISARMSLDSNEGDFYLFKTIEKYDEAGIRLIDDSIPYQVTFLNNNNIRNINTDINNRYCDDVPLSASGISLLAGKYEVMSMPVKGYDPVVPNMTLSHEFVEDTDFGASVTPITKYTTGAGVYGHTNWWVTFSAPTVLNSVYRMTLTFGDNTSIAAQFPVGAVDPGIAAIRDAIFNNLISDSRLSIEELHKTDDVFFTNTIFVKLITEPSATDIKDFTATIEVGSVPSFKSFKKAQYHEIGVVYNDEFGRYNIVNHSNTIFVPYHEFSTGYDKLSRLSFNLLHRPPLWAKTYRFVYKKKASYTYFIDVVRVEAIIGGTDNIPSGHTFVNVNSAIQFYRNTNSNVLISDYVWIKGDRCRSFYQREAGNPVFEISPFVRKYQPTPSTDAEDDGFIVKGVIPTFLQISTDKRFVDLEIFRPNIEFSGNIFYETGDSFEILDAGTEQRRHAATRVGVSNNGIDQSDDLAIPASGYFTFGDVYMRARIIPGGAPVIVEDSSYSDFYVSESMDKGRAVIKITGGSEQKTLHRAVRSENYIEGSEYNLLNVFLPQTEFFTVSQSYGPITGITEVGDVLKVIQEHKETSVYIGKAYLRQARGEDITVVSDKVFNEGNAYDSLHGTKYPRSIAVNERSLYYLDDTTCDLIRSSPNGQESISAAYKMKSYFKRKVEELRVSVNYTDIIVSIDSLYEEVLITFINGNSSETIAFYEKEGQKGFVWKAQIKPASGVPDNFAWYGDRLFSFLSGKLWKHNIGTDTNFYGDRKPCSVSFIVNAGAGDANKFSDIEMSSPDNVWDVVFDIAAGSNYPVQKTILKPAIIREKENRLYSGILRNILGRNNTEDVSKLRNGSQMTGETMLVTISNNTAGDYILKEVEVKFLTSK